MIPQMVRGVGGQGFNGFKGFSRFNGEGGGFDAIL